MKRLISALFCALMVMSLSLTAFAAPAPHSDCARDGHNMVVYNATCNGVDQTWYLKCTHPGCNERTTTTITCPGKDHKSGCHWLPV